jgi:hypothetical protein
MQTMREAWTDERLDDLNRHVEEGFRRIDGDLRGLRVETKTELTALRGEMNERFERVDADMKGLRSEMSARFESMQRTILHAALALSAAYVAGFAALIGLVATQL